ncbi:hypothetical protein N9J16_00200 [Candidatus Poseidoniaceae archaeon]|jgi:hypothetical protein|nr:hypothetical protein [Euryarchaeota archaeon]MDA9117148.1 hypothetical protein [Candidatus Poseidoniaceae archaeon]|tara:strand:- start:70 stop:993 length:924 start_codon:yes stop_codon:yes gene_type:complete
MNDLLASAPFTDIQPRIESICDHIRTASMVHIHAPADAVGVLSLSFIEAACLDLGVPYARRFMPPHRTLPRDEVIHPQHVEDGCLLFLDPFEDTWALEDLKEKPYHHLTPVAVSVRLGASKSERHGALDVVAQCAAIASALAPNGARVRRLRPFAGTGLWLREALDTTFDPVHTSIRDVLSDEGSIRVVALPDVPSPSNEMIPNLSARMLNRLTKAWPKMDVEARTQALSELVLPCLNDPKLSTPRIEELIWHRLLVGTHPIDVVSQVHQTMGGWPDGSDDAKIHASKLADFFIVHGSLIASPSSTD